MAGLRGRWREVVDAHRVQDGPGDVLGTHALVGGEFGAAIAGAVDLATTNPASRQETDMQCVQ